MSDFKKVMERYKDGTATKDEVMFVEEAIEKNKAINDYMAETIEAAFTDVLEEVQIDDIPVEHIKRRVNSRLRKNIILSVGIIMMIFLFLNYVLSPLVDHFYYDPTIKTYGEFQKDINYDMAAFTELNVAGYKAHRPIIDPKGFGAYDLTFRRSNTFKSTNYVTLGERIEIQLVRGKRLGYFDYLYGNNIYVKEYKKPDEFKGSLYDRPVGELKEMYPTNYVSAFVQLSDSIDLLDVVKLMDVEKDVDYRWLAVRNTDSLDGRPIGFSPSINDSYTVDDGFDKERYPFFDLGDLYDDVAKVYSEESHFNRMADVYDKHFKSLVYYLNDREEFVNLFGYNSLHHALYQETLDYIDENGIKVYGILLYGEAKSLVNFIESNEILAVNILDVKTSEYSK